jgi:hypothetical protein
MTTGKGMSRLLCGISSELAPSSKASYLILHCRVAETADRRRTASPCPVQRKRGTSAGQTSSTFLSWSIHVRWQLASRYRRSRRSSCGVGMKEQCFGRLMRTRPFVGVEGLRFTRGSALGLSIGNKGRGPSGRKLVVPVVRGMKTRRRQKIFRVRGQR